jgi:hypothetical protein
VPPSRPPVSPRRFFRPPSAHLSLSLPTHRSTEPAGASPTTARVGLRRHQEFEATVVLLLPPCRAHGDGRAPLFLCRSETEAGAVAASPPPGLAGDGGAAGRTSSAWRRQRGEGEPAAGSSASPSVALRMPRKGCARKRKGHVLACSIVHTERRWREDLPTARPTCQPRAGPPSTSSAAKIHLQALAEAVGSSPP